MIGTGCWDIPYPNYSETIRRTLLLIFPTPNTVQVDSKFWILPVIRVLFAGFSPGLLQELDYEPGRMALYKEALHFNGFTIVLA